MNIRKAVIAVAGFGTRFLPATKVVPKEMLPIVDKPGVQYLVEEAVASGVRDIILVTRYGTQLTADHFDHSHELEVHLAEQQQRDYLRIVQEVPRLANIAVVRQSRDLPYGNGSPLLAAKRYLDEGEPFVYMFGDDLVLSAKPCVQQLIDVYHEHRPDGVIAFQEVPQREISRYGAAKLKNGREPKELESLIEKPPLDQAPSNLAQLGRFVLPWRVIEILESLEVAEGKELYLTFANDQLCREGRMLAHPIEGTWFTTGDPLRFLKANVEFALRDPLIGEEFRAYLQNLDLGSRVRPTSAELAPPGTPSRRSAQ